MKEWFRNKKTLIPILLGIAIILISIVAFVVIGATSKKDNGRVSVVKLDNTQPTTNELGNTYGNKTDNKTKNETKNETTNKTKNEVDKDKDFGIDEFYQEAAKKFINGFDDDDEIEDFLEEYFDPKAYVAYENAGLEDSRFMEEYNNLDDNDERIDEVRKKVLDIPVAMEQVEELFIALSQNMDDTTMTDDEGNELDMADVDFTITLEDISEPEVSEDDENISRIVLTISMSGQESEIEMVFYDTVVIYIKDSDGNSFLDGVQVMEQ